MNAKAWKELSDALREMDALSKSELGIIEAEMLLQMDRVINAMNKLTARKELPQSTVEHIAGELRKVAERLAPEKQAVPKPPKAPDPPELAANCIHLSLIHI